MAFDTKVVPWIDEVQSYLKEGAKKTSELKKVLKSADFEKLSYADKAKLYQMFDPKCEITEELFKRQVDLYFSLLESKSSPMKIPVFSDYIDWVYAQDISKMNDKTFDILASRLLKTKATDLSEAIVGFMDRIPSAFDKDIDRLSNARISTLINILNEMDIEYTKLPSECKKFVSDMFRACAVKTEIADKNKDRVRRLFKHDPRYYYNIFNKAFAGVGEYETWIDEPAKKLTVPHMVNYANFQDKVLSNYRKPLTHATFATYAREMKLPRLPEYNPSSASYSQYYLRQPREYKDYAKKMGNLFAGMVQEEMSRVEKLYDEKRVTAYDLYDYASTGKAKTTVNLLNPYASKKSFLLQYSEFLIDLVHLDELTGQSYRDIYDASQIKETKAEVSTLTKSVTQKPKVESSMEERRYPQSKNAEVAGQYSLFGDSYISPYAYEEDFKQEQRETLIKREYTVEDLPELYELYNELVCSGKKDYALEEIIISLEDRKRESSAKIFGDEE